jgi:hypothetical protein
MQVEVSDVRELDFCNDSAKVIKEEIFVERIRSEAFFIYINVFFFFFGFCYFYLFYSSTVEQSHLDAH